MDGAKPPSSRPPWPLKAVLLTCVLSILATLVACVFLLRVEGVHRRAVALLTDPPPRPHGAVFELREGLLDERDAAVATGRLERAASINAQLSHEGLLRALALHRDWLNRRHPQTHLYSQSATRPEWNYRNTAADFFAFHLHTGMRLNPAAM